MDPIISYDKKILRGGVDLRVTADGGHIVALYGDYNNNGTLKIADCSLDFSYSDIQWVLNDDNSVTVTGIITGGILHRQATGIAPVTPSSQEIEVRLNNNQTFYQYGIPMDQTGDWNMNVAGPFSVTIPPSYTPQPSTLGAVHFRNYVINTTTPDQGTDEFYVGLMITNPNPPDYRPGATLSEVWLSHNRGGGKAHILGADSKWSQMRTANGGVDKGNTPSILKDSKWFNQRKLGKE